MKIQRIIRGGVKYVLDSNYRILYNASHGRYDDMPDEKYLKMIFKAQMGRELDLENPVTFNEKIQWLKLYDRDPRYTLMVDKFKVREYIARELGHEYLVPLLGVWDSPEEIDFDTLPERFVLKCNHNSGQGMCICKDKALLDIKSTISELQKGMDENYYLRHREWPYKDVPRKIIAEQYIEDSTLSELRDYKFFCFNGEVKFFKVDFDRFTDHHANYYDANCNLMRFGEKAHPPMSEKEIIFPDSIHQMMHFASKLSNSLSFLRVDFYDVDGHIYFGELTFFPASGFGIFTEESVDVELGKLLRLPEKSLLEN